MTKVLVNNPIGPSFIVGCMDPLALNYDPAANINCGVPLGYGGSN